MRRREFIEGLGSAAAWPAVARAQQPNRVRRIGVLMGYREGDPEGKSYISSFTQRLFELGWTESRNLRMDVRWAAGDFQEFADEAFADLLQKHGRPVDLKTALRHSIGEIEKRLPALSVQRRDASPRTRWRGPP
jgi:putative ABC transport system substrate-binding protein